MPSRRAMFYTGIAVAVAVMVSFINHAAAPKVVPKAEASSQAADPYAGIIWPTAIGRWNTGGDSEE